MRKFLAHRFNNHKLITINIETMMNAWALPLMICKDIYTNYGVIIIYLHILCIEITITYEEL